MPIKNYAKLLGSRGGKKRALRLTSERKREIALEGNRARQESIKLARQIEENFRYVEAINELSPSPTPLSLKTSGKLPGAL